MTQLLLKAWEVSLKAHRGKKDKGGKPYIYHPRRVAEMMHLESEKIVALLHDVCEDSPMTFEDLTHIGFSSEIVEAVKAITKVEGEAYEDYLQRIKQNPLARTVKIADMTHNSDLSRLLKVTPEDMKRREKYQKAIYLLSDI